MLHYTATPIQEIFDPLFQQAGVRVLLKREDLNHPLVSGNKWWKLKYNLEAARLGGYRTLLTFGGAYSNHLYATAAAARELGFESIGIVRGEETLPRNAMLQFATQQGMKLHYISREAYRRKNEPEFLASIRDQFGNCYIIPEGGTNALAVKGVAEFARSMPDNVDCVCCAVGTGGTLAGLIAGLGGRSKIVGIPVLKDAGFLRDDVIQLLPQLVTNWELITDYHFGGYAKTTPALNQFIKTFTVNTYIPLERVYTGKLVMAVYDLISKGYFQQGKTILVLHSGGLQGVC